LMSHSELMAISGSKSSGSLQLLPISESKAGSPAPSEPCNDRPGSRGGVPMVATVREEEEEEVDVGGRRDEASQASISTPTNLARRRSITETKTFRLKEEKNHINYETQQSIMGRGEAKPRMNTAEVAIQVDLSKTPVPEATPSPLPGAQSSSSRGATPTLLSETPTSPPPPPALPPAASSTLPTTGNLLKAAATLVSSTIPTEGNIRPSPGTRLARGFSHDDTLGGDEKRYSWREELEKFRATRRPLGGVSHLIDAFSSGATLAGSSSASSSRKSSTVDSFQDLEGVKARRRGSLQIQLDSASIAQLATRGESLPERESASKLQRRKSTSAIPPLRLSEALPNIDEAAVQPKDLKEGDLKEDDGSSENKNATTGDKLDPDKAVSETDASKGDGKEISGDKDNDDEKEVFTNGSDPEEGDQSSTTQGQTKGRAYLEKVNERKRTWDYFEINHPKAISDKKLEQLKEKYTRRKTEASLLLEKKKEEREVGKSEREGQSEKEGLKNGRKTLATTRTMSMPVIETNIAGSGKLQKKKSLELAWDPLTGESLLDQETESVDSGRESDVRRLSTSSTSEESASSRKSSRRKSSHLADILELADRIIPEQCVLECFIDPFTGQFITSEVAKVGNRRSLRVSVCGQVEDEEEGVNNRDEGVGSLPCTTPTTPTTTSTPLTLPTEAVNVEDEENGSLTSCCPTDDGICTSGSEGRPGVRGSALSLTSADDAGSE